MSQKLDITGTVCPFCVIKVKKQLDTLPPGETLVVRCDHPPAAKDSIPAFAEMNGYSCTITGSGDGLWELGITKKNGQD